MGNQVSRGGEHGKRQHQLMGWHARTKGKGLGERCEWKRGPKGGEELDAPGHLNLAVRKAAP